MKRLVSLLICVLLAASVLCGCSNTDINSNKLKIVTTIFPEYDWVRSILGEKSDDAEITMLLDNGVDLHSYNPSADDIIRISCCDIFIYVGGESDAWVDDALKQSTNNGMIVVNLLDVLGDAKYEEEEIIGATISKNEEESEEETEYDEHIWLSLKTAEICIKEITEKICEKDSENADIYNKNAEKYIKELRELDTKYKNAVNDAQKDCLVFTDRFPFRYLIEDYNLKYYAAFSGCSAESEASFETVSFLANKVDEFNLQYVIIIEGNSNKIADTVIANTKEKNAKVLTLNSLQSVTAKDINDGVTYLSVMENNLEVLKTALN